MQNIKALVQKLSESRRNVNLANSLVVDYQIKQPVEEKVQYLDPLHQKTYSNYLRVAFLEAPTLGQIFDSLPFDQEDKTDIAQRTRQYYFKQKEMLEYIFVFQVELKFKSNQEQKWLIRRRVADVLKLEEQINLELNRKQSSIDTGNLAKANKNPQNLDVALPSFASRLQHLVSQFTIMKKQQPELTELQHNKNVGELIQSFLLEIGDNEQKCKSNAFWLFMEFSDANQMEMQKFKECYVQKKSGGVYKYKNCCKKIASKFTRWKRRYIIITAEGILYSKGHLGQQAEIREMLMFMKYSQQILFGKIQTESDYGIQIITTSRKLMICAAEIFEFVDIIVSLFDALKSNPYIEFNEFDSFAPKRSDAICKWYIDAEAYFEDIHRALMKAEHDIMITDWWLSPELPLVRPMGTQYNQDKRLDRVLALLAKRGVKIFIIVYKEPSLFVNLNSQHTKNYLESLHPNIQVIRHPNTVLPTLWSHHEKMVIIDQSVGFMGGIDLCWARFDTNDHFISDEAVCDEEKKETLFYYPGMDYASIRIKDYTNVHLYNQSCIDRKENPRMPWHDIAIQVIGEPVKDMTRHFIQYWNFVKVDVYDKQYGRNNTNSTSQFKQLIVPQQIRKSKRMSSSNKNQIENLYIEGSNIKSMQSKSNDPAQQQQQQSGHAQQPIQPQQQPQQQAHIGDDKLMKPKNRTSLRFSNYMDNFQMSLIVNNNTQLDRGSSQEDNSDHLSGQPNNLTKQNDQAQKKISPPSLFFKKPQPSQFLEKLVEQNSEMSSNYSQEFEQNIPHANRVDSLTYIAIRCDTAKATQNRPHQVNSHNYAEEYKSELQIPIDEVCEFTYPQEDQFKEMQARLSNRRQYKQQKLEISIKNEYCQDDTLSNKKNKNKDIEQLSNHLNVQQCVSNFGSPVVVNRQIGQNNRVGGGTGGGGGNQVINLNEIPLTTPRSIGGGGGGANLNFFKSIELQQIIKRLEQSTKPSENQFYYFGKQKTQQKNQSPQPNQQLNLINPVKDIKEIKMDTSIIQAPPQFSTSAHKRQQEAEEKANWTKSKIIPNFKPQLTAKGSCTCQLLRSSSSWSLGLDEDSTEISIQFAYITLINNAEHYIYIENQFFISSTAGECVKNQIAEALIQRIERAAQYNQVFRVYIIIPLLPGFPGNICDPSTSVLKCQLHWEYNTICRGGNSILERLRKNPQIQDPSKYIRFFGLRTHGIVNQKPMTEIVYVHSKLMIVDDKFCIIGSANINDRSMQGARDSEIAIVVEDQKKKKVYMNGLPYMCGKFNTLLRMALFQEHFGLNMQQARDPIGEETFQLISQNAKRNTEIYRELFRCYPDDQMETLEMVAEQQKLAKIDKYDIIKAELKGLAVEFPLNFLSKENLNFSITQKEIFVPTESFT